VEEYSNYLDHSDHLLEALAESLVDLHELLSEGEIDLDLFMHDAHDLINQCEFDYEDDDEEVLEAFVMLHHITNTITD
jgi:hypothetical protein